MGTPKDATSRLTRYAPQTYRLGDDLHALANSAQVDGNYSCAVSGAGLISVSAIDAAGHFSASARLAASAERFDFDVREGSHRGTFSTAAWGQMRLGTNNAAPGVVVTTHSDGSASATIGDSLVVATPLENGDFAINAVNSENGQGFSLRVPFSEINVPSNHLYSATLNSRHTLDCKTTSRVMVAGDIIMGIAGFAAFYAWWTGAGLVVSVILGGVGGILVIAGGIAWFIQKCG